MCFHWRVIVCKKWSFQFFLNSIYFSVKNLKLTKKIPILSFYDADFTKILWLFFLFSFFSLDMWLFPLKVYLNFYDSSHSHSKSEVVTQHRHPLPVMGAYTVGGHWLEKNNNEGCLYDIFLTFVHAKFDLSLLHLMYLMYSNGAIWNILGHSAVQNYLV